MKKEIDIMLYIMSRIDYSPTEQDIKDKVLETKFSGEIYREYFQELLREKYGILLDELLQRGAVALDAYAGPEVHMFLGVRPLVCSEGWYPADEDYWVKNLAIAKGALAKNVYSAGCRFIERPALRALDLLESEGVKTGVITSFHTLPYRIRNIPELALKAENILAPGGVFVATALEPCGVLMRTYQYEYSERGGIMNVQTWENNRTTCLGKTFFLARR